MSHVSPRRPRPVHTIQPLEPRALLTGDLAWAASVGGPLLERADAIATDPAGNVYVAGSFAGLTRPGATRILRARGGADAFLAKYSPAGVLLWSQAFGGAGQDRAIDLAVTPGGRVLVTGTFHGAADFAPGAATSILRSRGGADAFVASYAAASGKLQWARAAGSTADDAPAAIAADGNGHVVVAGEFRRTIAFPKGKKPLTLTSAGRRDAFVWSLGATDGATRFARGFGGASDDAATGVALDSLGAPHVTGHFQGSADLDPTKGTFPVTSHGDSDAFLAVLTAAGAFRSAAAFGGAGADAANAVDVDDDGVAYLTGSFTGAVDFGGAGVAAETLTSAAGSADAFILARDPAGATRLIKSIGGTGPDEGLDIAVDPAGAIYTAGAFSEMPDFDTGSGVYNRTSAGGEDGFVSKITASGRFVYARTFGSAEGDDSVCRVALSATGSVAAAGCFAGRIDVDPGAAAHPLAARGAGDGFVVVLDQSEPTFGFAMPVGHTGPKELVGLSVDSADNLYLTGSFSGAFAFGAAPNFLTYTSNGGRDAWVGRTCNKGFLNWAHSFGGAGDDFAVASIPLDDGSLLVTGAFSRTVDFDAGPGVANLTSAGGLDIFVLKLNPAGNFLWARSYGGEGDDVPADLVLAGDAAHLAATTRGGFSFGSTPIAPLGGSDAMLAAFDAAGGAPEWAIPIGGAGNDTASALAVGPLGELYLAGSFTAGANFDFTAHGPHTLTPTGPQDAFLARYASDGAFNWARQISPTGGADANDLAVAPSGDVFLALEFAGSWDGLSSAATSGALVKFDPAGNELWRRGILGDGDDGATALSVDPGGNVYLAGHHAGLNAGPLATLLPASNGGATDGFLAKFSPAGEALYAGTLGGASADGVHAVAARGSGSFVYALGYFTGAADLDPTAAVSTQYAANGARDAFLMRLLF